MYVDLLLGSLSGKSSELSMILQHLYHLQYYKSMNQNLASDVDEIIFDEMENMDVLGDLIKQLGGKPEYKMDANENKYWSADVIDYGTDFCTMLKSDMVQKKAVIDEYTSNIEKIGDRTIKNILKRMLKQEIMHYNIFEEYYEQFCDSNVEDTSYQGDENDMGCPYCRNNDNTMNNNYANSNVQNENYGNEPVMPEENLEMPEDENIANNIDATMENAEKVEDTKEQENSENDSVLPYDYEYYDLYSDSNNEPIFAPDEFMEGIFCNKDIHLINNSDDSDYGCEAGCECNCSEENNKEMDINENYMNLNFSDMINPNAPLRYRTSRPRNRVRRYM